MLTLDLSKDQLSGPLAKYVKPLEALKELDESLEKEGGVVPLTDAPGKRLVYSPVGPINRDYDDVRRFSDAAFKGVKRALKAGAKNPLVVLPSSNGLKAYNLFDAAVVLGAYYAVYVVFIRLQNHLIQNRLMFCLLKPLEIREAIPTKAKKLDSINFANFEAKERSLSTYRLANAIESGLSVARDIGGSDPERMSAPNVAQYVQQLFEKSPVKVNVISDSKTLEKEFPCFGKTN